MNTLLLQRQPKSLLDDAHTMRKLALNHERNKKQDHTRLMDEAAAAFRYEDCRTEMWNPEEYSLLFGTPLWSQSTPAQRVLLNQLYWVAYYSQIISAEIATILLNQTAGAGLYTLEDFRAVCDTLDLESSQERAHIAAFKKISEEVEQKVFGERVFTYPMRSMFSQTMIFADTNAVKDYWRQLQLRFYTQLSAGNAFIGCQYFTVRGIRTLNGKIVQHALSRYYTAHPDPDSAPIPSKISYFHFMDESYHFNSSGIVSHDVVKTLKAPTAFERLVANAALDGCQKDHFHFSAAINGIFWYDPALFGAVYKILRSPAFGLDDAGARLMLEACFARDNDAIQASHRTHREAVASYKAYLADLPHVSVHNKEMRLMSSSGVEGYLRRNRAALARFRPGAR
jgi:hypothetical protein